MTELKKPLSREEEIKAFTALAEGEPGARELLIEHNLRLVGYIIKRYEKWGMDQDDMMSIGSMGLIKAVDSFKLDKGLKFATYATRCIENELGLAFRKVRKQPNQVSLDEPVFNDKDGNELTLADMLSDGNAVEEAMDDKATLCILNQAMDVLSAREHKVLVLRFGLYGKTKLRQVDAAKEMGISQTWLCRIEKQALNKLKKQMNHLTEV